MVIVLAAACAGEPRQPGGRGPRADYASPIVLFVSPDSAEVEGMRRELDDDFEVIADDAMWYRAQARELADSLGMAHAEVHRGQARFRVDGAPRLFSWRDASDTWFAVVYDGAHPPRIVSDVDLRAVLEGGSAPSRATRAPLSPWPP